MKAFDEYRNQYQTIRMERREGILQITFHSDGGSLRWGEVPHRELGYAFADIAGDPENRVVIMTGTGEGMITRGANYRPAWQTQPPGIDQPLRPAVLWDKTFSEGRRLLLNLLEIEVPVVSAINGHVRIHSEIPLLGDLVLAEESTVFQDPGHFPGAGLPPGDGMHLVYPLLIGTNRAKYFMYTGQEISAPQALDLGLVNEVLPRERLLPRAWELAELLAQKPILTLRYTKQVLNLQVKRLLQDMLAYGLAVEGLAAVDKFMGEQ